MIFSVEGIQLVISTRGGGWLQSISGTASEWSMWLLMVQIPLQKSTASSIMKKIINASAHIL